MVGAAGCDDGDGRQDSAAPATTSQTLPLQVNRTDPGTQLEVLTAAAVRRVRLDNDGVPRHFETIAIVDTLGTGNAAGFVLPDRAGIELSPAERRSLVDALSQDVEFLERSEAEGRVEAGLVDAALILARPEADGDSVVVVSELHCGRQGGLCSDGGHHLLERDDGGTWRVTKSEGWIS